MFWAYEGQLAVREGNWKLVLNGKLDFGRAVPDAVHLSDLETDPGERINVSWAFPDKARELQEALTRWYAQFRPETPVSETDG